MLNLIRTGRLARRILPLLLLGGLLTGGTAQARPQNLQELANINKKLTESGIEYGQIPSLYRPRFDRMQDAGLSMNADDVVFVVMLPDGPRIYPQKYLVWHQVINEVVDDHAYAITYSPITGGFAAYDASMGGLNLIFDAEGRLYDGNSVLIDRNSGSLWLQELGMAFDGSLLGRGMPLVPCYWTTWGPARRTFPGAKVLSRPPGRRPYGRDPYGDYRKDDTYYTNDELVYPVERVDRRFPRKTPMFCLEHQGSLIALDINYVKKKGAVNFFVGPSALVAVHDKKLDVVRVFNRQVWAEPFLFVYSGNQFIDISTRSIWDPATPASTATRPRVPRPSLARSWSEAAEALHCSSAAYAASVAFSCTFSPATFVMASTFRWASSTAFWKIRRSVLPQVSGSSRIISCMVSMSRWARLSSS